MKGRLEWLEQEGAASVEDISLLVLAVRGWAEQRAMYAANLAVPDPNDPDQTSRNEEAARETLTGIRSRLADVGVTASQLVYELDRVLYLTTVVLGEVRLRDRARGKLSYTISGREGARDFAEQLRSLLQAAGIQTPGVPAFPPEVTVIGEDMDESCQNTLDRLMYLVRPEEVLLGVYLGRGAGRGHNFSARRSVLMLTNERVLGLRNRTFEKTGDLLFEAPLDKIEQVVPTKSYQFAAVRIAMLEGLKLPGKTGVQAFEMNMDQESSDLAARAISNAMSGASSGQSRVPIGPVWHRNDLREYAGVERALVL